MSNWTLPRPLPMHPHMPSSLRGMCSAQCQCVPSASSLLLHPAHPEAGPVPSPVTELAVLPPLTSTSPSSPWACAGASPRASCLPHIFSPSPSFTYFWPRSLYGFPFLLGETPIPCVSLQNLQSHSWAVGCHLLCLSSPLSASMAICPHHSEPFLSTHLVLAV